MKKTLRDYPVVALALLLLACVKFEYQTETWSIHSSGLSGGVIVLAIIAIVLLFRIFNAAHDACISRGLLKTRIRSKYDLLIPIGIFAALIQARWYGAPFHGEGTSGHRWEVALGDPAWAIPFIAALVGVVFLTRILYLLRAIAQETNNKS